MRRSKLQCPCSDKCNGKLDQSRGLYIGKASSVIDIGIDKQKNVSVKL